MENKEYLTEERYERVKKKIIFISMLILLVGLLIGGGLIGIGLNKQSKINSKYSENNKASLSEQLETEKQVLVQVKTELEEKIKPVEDEIKNLERVAFNGFDDDYYARKDQIDELRKSILDDQKSISTINQVLDDSFSRCKFDEAKNNNYTSKYCSIKNELNEISDKTKKDFESSDSIPFYMFGGFAIIATCMISLSVYMMAKRREIVAFQAQQIMPVAKEGIDKMSPTMGKAAGEVAKGITKGIKEGLKDDDK